MFQDGGFGCVTRLFGPVLLLLLINEDGHLNYLKKKHSMATFGRRVRILIYFPLKGKLKIDIKFK
jgi:hypothetical protein